MLGHRREHHRVRPALGDQQRDFERAQDVVASISLAARLARIRAGTVMLEHSRASTSSGGSGRAGNARTRARIPQMLVGRSSALASAKWPQMMEAP